MSTHVIDSRDVEELLIERADGLLGDEQTSQLRGHLAVCSMCAGLARQHERLAQRLGAQLPYADAQQTSLTRIRQGDLRRRVTFWPKIATAAAAVFAIVVGSLGISEAVGRFQIPERELVAEASENLGGDSVVLRVEDGRFAARPDQTSGVLVSADLRLATPVRGSAEVRFAATGEPYGILASAPDLAGVTRLHLENAIPRVDSATVMEVWLHIEGTEARDSGHIAFRIEPTHGGLRAHSLR